MATYPPAVQRLLDELMHLPGVGPKTAERYVFSLLRQPPERLQSFAKAMAEMRRNIVVCDRCHNFDEKSPCRYCRDKQRDQNTICIVADAPDVVAIEQTGMYRGQYHILGGTINTVEGQGPERLFIGDLLERIAKVEPPHKDTGRNPALPPQADSAGEKISEVIMAMNPDIEGETTALYLKKVLTPYKVKITQLARGIPTGGDVTYMDEATLGEAINHRQAA